MILLPGALNQQFVNSFQFSSRNRGSHFLSVLGRLKPGAAPTEPRPVSKRPPLENKLAPQLQISLSGNAAHLTECRAAQLSGNVSVIRMVQRIEGLYS